MLNQDLNIEKAWGGTDCEYNCWEHWHCRVAKGQKYSSKWGGKAKRLPPDVNPTLKHTPTMPDYRRNRVPGGTYFFTVNPLERRSGLLVQ